MDLALNDLPVVIKIDALVTLVLDVAFSRNALR